MLRRSVESAKSVACMPSQYPEFWLLIWGWLSTLELEYQRFKTSANKRKRKKCWTSINLSDLIQVTNSNNAVYLNNLQARYSLFKA